MILDRRAVPVFVLALLGCATGAVAVATTASAATNCPTGQSSNWINTSGGAYENPSNWSNGVPGSGCDASIVAAGTYTVVITDGESANSLTLGGASGTQTLQLQGVTTSTGDPRQAIFIVPGAQTVSVGAHGVIQLTSSGTNPGAAILGGGTVVNSGLVKTDPGTSGPSTFKDIRANVTNNQGATVEFNADTSSCGCGSGGTWINNGTITTASGTSSYLSRSGAGENFSQPTSTGTIANSGNLTVDGLFTNTAGTTSGNPVQVCGSLAAPSPGSAKFAFAQRTVCNGWNLASDIGAATTVLADNESTTNSITVGLSQDITNNGALTFDGGAAAQQVQFASGHTLTNEGTLSFVQPGSSLLTVPLVNHGSVNLGAGNSLTVHGAITQTAGTFTLASGATLTTNYPVTLAGGTIANSGTLSESDTFTHTGGTTTGVPIQICGGTVDAPGTGTANFLLVRNNVCPYPNIGSDIGAGNTIEVQASTITADTFFGSIVNHGTLRLTGDQTNQLHGTLLTNYGTFAIAAGTGNMAMQLVNHGAVNVASGATVNFGNTVSLDDGTVDVDGSFNAGTVTQSGGVTTVDGTASVTDLGISGGTVQGTGTIAATGSITNTGGTVHPGNSPGVLHITGNYTQSSGGTLALAVTGTAPGTGYSQLAVSGTASLGGTVQVANPTTVTKPLRVLTAAALSGTFATITSSGQRFTTAYDATGVTLTPVPLVVTPPVVRQALTRVSLTPATIRQGKASALHFTLAKAGTVTVRITHRVAGHRLHGKCTVHATHGKRCHVTKSAGRRTIRGKAGANTASLPVGSLKAGRYRITVTVAGSAGKPLVVTRTLVVKAKKTK